MPKKKPKTVVEKIKPKKPGQQYNIDNLNAHGMTMTLLNGVHVSISLNDDAIYLSFSRIDYEHGITIDQATSPTGHKLRLANYITINYKPAPE